MLNFQGLRGRCNTQVTYHSNGLEPIYLKIAEYHRAPMKSAFRVLHWAVATSGTAPKSAPITPLKSFMEDPLFPAILLTTGEIHRIKPEWILTDRRRVRWWDNDNQVSSWSSVAQFDTGFFNQVVCCLI